MKAATSLAIPRAWTLPFILVPVELTNSLAIGAPPAWLAGWQGKTVLADLAGNFGRLIMRSSVVGESIWERGTYESIQLDLIDDSEDMSAQLVEAAASVLRSTAGRPAGLMIQRYLCPTEQGEFGNLQRISKTRDHWEISTRDVGGFTTRLRVNSQRDRAADPDKRLAIGGGVSRERLFGAVGAWLNNELVLGRSRRLNCEWIGDADKVFLVQIDEEDEDLSGVNPFQVRVAPARRPSGDNGSYLKLADAGALTAWDKLQVLEQLWESDSPKKPTLFYVPISDLPSRATKHAIGRLASDFDQLIGPRGIIVRTSVRAGAEKTPNLDRTECLTPAAAAKWCFETARKLKRDYQTAELSFVAHRFVASRASAWARAEPENPIVEINALWGLPDALQYCPYDIWEVHIPTGLATDYPDYKSDMLISSDDGSWEYVRVKNELARANSIGSGEAREIAQRSARIATRLGRACHIMWFVGCVEEDNTQFNIPWYWTEAHEATRNPDRAAYRVVTVNDHASLDRFIAFEGSRARQALALHPSDLQLMRDNHFIEAVGSAASEAHVPVILSGSTLAHVYYQLRKLGCTVVTPGEKEHARVRRSLHFGKLVRDKIPGRIKQRREMGVTRRVEGSLRKGFLLSKLFEEAMELREATEGSRKVEEFGDLFEVFCALAESEGVTLEAIRKAADDKKRKAGGFDEGLILLRTAIAAPDHIACKSARDFSDLLGEHTSDDTAEIPFSFFGFMSVDQPRTMVFSTLGVRLELLLRTDRLELRLFRLSEQLELPLLDRDGA